MLGIYMNNFRLLPSIRLFSNLRAKSKIGKKIQKLPLCLSNIPIPDNVLKVFGNDKQKIMNFLTRFCSAFRVQIPTLQVVETTKNTNHELYEVLAHNKFVLSDKVKVLLKPEYAQLDTIDFYGRGKTISAARQNALKHLAEVVFTLLAKADLFMPSVEQDPKKVSPYIKVEFPDSIRAELMSKIERCKDLISTIEPEAKIVSMSNAKFESENSFVSSRKFSRPEALKGALPIYRHYSEIVSSIEHNQVTILSATTGSGKTTQIPKFILHHFGDEMPSVVVTQPRRVAAISLANRLAHELGESSVGRSVGFNVRFESVLPDPSKSNILFCTSGLLLRKFQSLDDLTIARCTHLILDEIHERDVNTDILLMAVRRLLLLNKKIKIIVMSATLESSKFHDYFREISGISVGKPIKIETGTNFPIMKYSLEDSIAVLKSSKLHPNWVSPITRTFLDKELNGDEPLPEVIPIEIVSRLVKYLHTRKPDGSILCFLPGWEEIQAVKTELEKDLYDGNGSKAFGIYCIHSSAPPEVAQSIFQKTEGVRKIILSTNIAESSITIPDVAYIVDSGKQKINMYNPNLRMNSLKSTWISRSNSLQRLGRVGRTQPGEYYLLCSKNRNLAPSFPPEILRVGLEEVCLAIKGLGFEGKFKNIVTELLDKPDKQCVRDAVERLVYLGALDQDTEDITELGKMLSKLPLNPSLAKGLLLSQKFSCLSDFLTLSASIGERVLRNARFEDEKEACASFVRELREKHCDDHQVLLNLYKLYQERRLGEVFSRDQVIKFISTAALKRISRIRSSLESQLSQISSTPSQSERQDQGPESAQLTKLLVLSSLYPDMAFKMSARNAYLLPGGISAEAQKESMNFCESLENMIASNSTISSGSANAVVYEELFEVGFRMLVKTSNVDPLFSALFAKDIEILGNNSIRLDGWIHISANDFKDLKLLMDMRHIWHKGANLLLFSTNPTVIKSIRDCFGLFMKYWNPHRHIEIK